MVKMWEVKLDVGTDAGQCHKFLGCPLLPSRSDLCMLKGIWCFIKLHIPIVHKAHSHAKYAILKIWAL